MVRKAKLSDLEFIYSLAISTPELKPSSDNLMSKNEIKEWIKDEKSNLFLVEENKGFLFCKLMSNEWCVIETLVVDKKQRNKGIAKKLLEKLYLILKEKKIKFLTGLVLEKFENSREFWKKNGFIEKNKLIWFEKELK